SSAPRRTTRCRAAGTRCGACGGWSLVGGRSAYGTQREKREERIERRGERTWVSTHFSPLSSRLKASPLRLLPFDRLEQRLEVAGAKALGALALDDLVEQRRPVLDRLGEDLQQVALVVAVDQDAQLRQRRQVLVDRADPLGHRVVVRLRH